MRVYLAFIGCVLIWGSTWYAIELQLGVVPKEWSLFYRFGLASLVLFLICLIRRERLKLAPSQHFWTASTGLFLFSGSYILTYSGAEYLTSGLVAVTFSLLSFLNIVNARIFLGNKIESSRLMAALVGIAGLTLIFQPEIQAFNFEDTAVRGIAFCVAATLACSFGNTFAGAPQSQMIPLLSFNAYSIGYGAFFDLMFALSTGKPIAFDMQASYIGSLLHLSLMGTVVAFTMYIWLIEQIGVGRAAYMSVMVPIVALIASTFLEGFIWSMEAIIGLTMVVSGNVLMIKNRKAASTQPSETPEPAHENR